MRRLVLSGNRLTRWGRPSSPKSSAPSEYADDPPHEDATYYVPPRYLPLSKAVYLWAKKENKLAWMEDMHPKEESIYEGLGSAYEVRDLYDLWKNPGPKCSRAVSAAGRHRLELLNAGNRDLRDGLAAGDLTAVEHTRATGCIEEIEPRFWNSDSAASVFVSSKRLRTKHLDQYEIRILVPLADFNSWIKTQVSSRRETLVELMHSGAPGRPSSMHLVIAEAKRRIAAKKLPDLKTQFGKQLSEWLKADHPGCPPVTQKTVTNNREITSLFRKAQTEARN